MPWSDDRFITEKSKKDKQIWGEVRKTTKKKDDDKVTEQAKQRHTVFEKKTPGGQGNPNEGKTQEKNSVLHQEGTSYRVKRNS